MQGDLIIRPAKRTVIFAFMAYAVVMSVFFIFAFHGLDTISAGGMRAGFLSLAWRLSAFLGALLVGYAYLFYRMTTLRVARDEVTKKSGIVVRDFVRVGIDKITNYTYHRSPLALLFGFVDLEIESSGSTDTAPGIIMHFLCMRDVKAVMGRIRQEKEAFNSRRGSQVAEKKGGGAFASIEPAPIVHEYSFSK